LEVEGIYPGRQTFGCPSYTTATLQDAKNYEKREIFLLDHLKKTRKGSVVAQ
jgi:hypothetical protein